MTIPIRCPPQVITVLLDTAAGLALLAAVIAVLHAAAVLALHRSAAHAHEPTPA